MGLQVSSLQDGQVSLLSPLNLPESPGLLQGSRHVSGSAGCLHAYSLIFLARESMQKPVHQHTFDHFVAVRISGCSLLLVSWSSTAISKRGSTWVMRWPWEVAWAGEDQSELGSLLSAWGRLWLPLQRECGRLTGRCWWKVALGRHSISSQTTPPGGPPAKTSPGSH